MAADLAASPRLLVVGFAALVAASVQCGRSSAVVPGEQDAAATLGAPSGDAPASSCAALGCTESMPCCPVVSSDGSSFEEGGSREGGGEPDEGASTADGANGGSEAHRSTDAISAVDGEPPDVAIGEAGEPSDAPPQPGGDAGECVVDSDCEPGQWCVQFNTALGPAILTHYRCVTATCTALDCSCAQSMCGTGYNCWVDAGRLVCQDLTGV